MLRTLTQTSHRIGIILFSALFSSGLYSQNFECFELSYDEQLQLNVPKARVYFIGETHNIASNDLLDFKLIELLNSTYGLRTIIKEGSYSYVYFLNEFIQTGNEDLLETLSSSLGHYVEEQPQFLNAIRKINSSRSKEERLEIFSIDAETFYHVPAMVNYWKIKWGVPIDDNVKQSLKTLSSFQPSTFSFFLKAEEKKIIREIVSKVKLSVDTNEELFSNYLQTDFLHLKMILENYATKKRTDKSLASNFEHLHNTINRDYYYFSYGRLHAQKKNGWLADRINQSTSFYNSVVSINPIYKNSSFTWKGQSIHLDDFEKLNPKQKMKITSFNCDEPWILIESTTISDKGDFDFYLIASGQKGITIIEE